jgi:hypothetical protein
MRAVTHGTQPLTSDSLSNVTFCVRTSASPNGAAQTAGGQRSVRLMLSNALARHVFALTIPMVNGTGGEGVGNPGRMMRQARNPALNEER